MKTVAALGVLGLTLTTEPLTLMDIKVQESLGICCIVAEVDWNDSSVTENDLLIKRFSARNVIGGVIGTGGFLFEESDMKFGIILYSDSDREVGAGECGCDN